MSSIDIVIVNYNSTDYLMESIRSVYDALKGTPARILIQDNHSSDGVDRVKAEFSQVKLRKNASNIGYAKAINNAVRTGNSAYIVILNPDSEIIDGFFDCIIDYMEQHIDVGIVGPKVLDHEGLVQGSARAFPTFLTGLFGRSSLLTKVFPNNRLSRANILTTLSDGETPMEADWVSGACMVVRRKAIDEVGLMDERFFMYWEDADWCKRMWEKGWKVVYLPRAQVIHHTGKSSAQRPLRSTLEFHKSSYLLFEKYAKGLIRLLLPFVFCALALRIALIGSAHMLQKLTKKRRGMDDWRE